MIRSTQLVLGNALRCVVAGTLALMSVAATPAGGEIAKEYQVKAGFLYNFTKFVEWEPQCFAREAAPLVIGVLGPNPFGDELQKIVRGRKVNGREIAIINVRSIDEARMAHVMFVPGGTDARLAQRLTALYPAGVLTVGETLDFAASGGMITFVLVGDKVRFEINVAAAERAGLKISAQLQKLATVVRHDP